jgi:predicted MFS family arabinose efflux permease
MLVAGRLVDRYGAARLMPFHLLPMGLGMVFLAAFDAPLWAAVYLFLVALTSGVSFTASVAMWAELYGVRHIGAIKSLASAIMVFASALGPAFMGVLFDAGVSMSVVCLMFALYTVVGTALIWGALRGVSARG